MTDSGNDRQWRWDGQRWLWWNGYSWQEGDPEAADSLPPMPAPHAHPEAAAAATAPAVAPGAVAATPAPPRRGLSAGGITAIVLGAVLALVIIGGTAAFILTRGGGDGDATVTLRTEPISSAVAAFTPPAGTDVAVTPAPTSAVTTIPASTAGLYGGTLDTASCNKDQLVAFLTQNPEQGAAWAGVLGIAPAQIADFVAPLTPVILRSDTAVTNHGFENGRATAVPAVLQAGTAVLVNSYGQPVVKCYCGNPLTPAPAIPAKVRYTGPTWPTFTAGAYTIVQPTTVAITVFTLTNVVNGEPFDRPAGTTGAQDSDAAEEQAAADKAAADKAAADAAAAQAAEDARAAAEAAAAAQAAEDARAAANSGSATDAVGLLMGRLDSCAIAVLGPATEYTPVGQDPALSFSTAPGAGPGLYRVTMTDSSDGTAFVFTVNVGTGAVTAGNEAAAGVEMECPGVFD